MMRFVSRLLSRGEPAFYEARPSDAAAIAAVHGASFQRGWGEDEIHRLLIEKSVVAHRAMRGRKFVGFIVSRLAAGEAEILSAAPRRNCSICICADWPVSASARCFSKSASKMSLAAASTGARVSMKWAGAKAITKAAPPPWCCAAISADART